MTQDFHGKPWSFTVFRTSQPRLGTPWTPGPEFGASLATTASRGASTINANWESHN